MAYGIKEYNYIDLDFTKFIDFLWFVTNNSKIKLGHKTPSEHRLLFENSNILRFEYVEPITELYEVYIHNNYVQILSKKVLFLGCKTGKLFMILCSLWQKIK